MIDKDTYDTDSFDGNADEILNDLDLTNLTETESYGDNVEEVNVSSNDSAEEGTKDVIVADEYELAINKSVMAEGPAKDKLDDISIDNQTESTDLVLHNSSNTQNEVEVVLDKTVIEETQHTDLVGDIKVETREEIFVENVMEKHVSENTEDVNESVLPNNDDPTLQTNVSIDNYIQEGDIITEAFEESNNGIKEVVSDDADKEDDLELTPEAPHDAPEEEPEEPKRFKGKLSRQAELIRQSNEVGQA